MSFTSDLLAAVAQDLADASVGTWRPTSPYQANDPVPIVLSGLPSSPDTVIVLTPYPISDDYAMSDSVVGVQVHMRGDRDPRTVEALADAVFNRLHGRQGLDFASGRVVMCWRSSETPMGVDSNSRFERSANYYLTCWRPSPNRT